MITGPIVADVQTNTVGLIIFKVPLVGITIWMTDFSLPVSSIVLPLPLIFSSVMPDLYPKPLSLLALRIYLSSVDAAVIILDRFDWIFFQ